MMFYIVLSVTRNFPFLNYNMCVLNMWYAIILTNGNPAHFTIFYTSTEEL